MDIRTPTLLCVLVGMFLLSFLILSYLGRALATELSLVWAVGWTMAVLGIFMKWANTEKWQIPFYLGIAIILMFPFLVDLSLLG